MFALKNFEANSEKLNTNIFNPYQRINWDDENLNYWSFLILYEIINENEEKKTKEIYLGLIELKGSNILLKKRSNKNY